MGLVRSRTQLVKCKFKHWQQVHLSSSRLEWNELLRWRFSYGLNCILDNRLNNFDLDFGWLWQLLKLSNHFLWFNIWKCSWKLIVKVFQKYYQLQNKLTTFHLKTYNKELLDGGSPKKFQGSMESKPRRSSHSTKATYNIS